MVQVLRKINSKRLFLSIIICLFATFSIVDVYYANSGVALLVNGVDGSKAGYNAINTMEKLIKSHEQWKDCTIVPRSEERRVGKECRSRWSPYQ